MFTGIVEEVGTVVRTADPSTFQLRIEAPGVTGGLKVSDSICTNGVCLTVTNKKDKIFEVQVMPQTLEKTNLGMLKSKSKVNLERALLPTSFVGGHLVTGDIDGLAKIEKIEPQASQWVLTLRPPSLLEKYIAPQGRVTLQGVSLTVAEKKEGRFKVCLIPHTVHNTTLKQCREGDVLNLEVDILAKYIGEMLASEDKPGITFNFLREAGY